jgi:hypothetical protein
LNRSIFKATLVSAHHHAAAAAAAAAGLATLQALRDQVSMTKYQQLQKDLEPQNTAGLDVALSDTLHSLAQQTQLGPAQVSSMSFLHLRRAECLGSATRQLLALDH